ncbi:MULTISPECIES: IS1595 family transposase [unclassified Bradyrhizobium]|uniref:IS1595 family transposase n=1 Tax=unclassified Bradyrhizobium TaxID=2631580 RepID=UPI001BA4B6EA|nr:MULTISPECIES: IS1595 family transposase [unclassified Bradyrhizobium]MBR1207092.1 IS1595 family transposase [Bradyrhizobium sp. AUGA SZCCT0124]MBR1313631.1 IS1595 family transposase [Bradyrhizobium sp. AUGA SZCCT0051]MBR1343272.1 IS1595 family transposase [Bradyrhizobium sp. AUGA SZCCT0105]MBR1357308.1 IS1595 family transposase [Bradyrhizobium sp. AUGA SZCCT0045]
MSQFNAPHFQSPEAARDYLEALRWGSDRVCPHCGTVNESFLTKKPGVYRCRTKECRKDFSVTTKSVMESSHIKLNVWLQAFYLMASSKKGISSHQLHRALGITYKSAWFLTHRIREAMRSGGLLPPLGGGAKTVEVDETYIGRPVGAPKKGRHGVSNKNTVLTLVERGGSVRSFHVDGVRIADIAPIITANISRESKLMTDEAGWYKELGRKFLRHDTVHHRSEEYVRYTNAKEFPGGADYVIHTNTVEGYYSIFKRGMKGVYQHCAEKHLHRYLSEFDFRYSNRVALGIGDGERADLAIKGAAGKRLTYRQPH